jgi:RNA polymerase sigma-70 factor (ECF subfamily)
MTATSESTSLSEAVQSAVARGRASWPEVDVADDAFAGYLLARAEGADPGGLHVGDLYLACACARGDARAVAIFDRTFLAPVEAIVARTGAALHVGGEVAQVLRERLLVGAEGRRPGIVDYAGRGPLAGWIRVVAIRAAADIGRAERTRQTAESASEIPAESPEDAAVRAKYGAAFDQAFRDAFRALSAEDRVVLRLHFAEGLNLDRLAVVLGFSRATAGRRMIAARTRLRDGTMQLLGERLSASRDEIESVLAALRSRLDVSMSALVTAA